MESGKKVKVEEPEKNGSQRIINSKTIIALLFAIIFLLAFSLGYFINFISKTPSQKTLEEIIAIIEQKAISKGEEEFSLDETEIFNLIKEQYLDDYAEYYTAEEYQIEQQKNAGSYSGVGLTFQVGNYKTVYGVMGNSPAESAGFKTGDIIIAGKKQGGEKQELKTSSEVNEFFTSLQVDETVEVTVLRGLEELTLEVAKKPYKTTYVTYTDSELKMTFGYDNSSLKRNEDYTNGNAELDGKTAVITLSQFQGESANQLVNALSYMVERGREKLIFDLRNNGGGSLDILTQIASYFIYNGGNRESVVLYAKGKENSTFYSTNSNNYISSVKSVIVLANENTASASECLIGAMLYYGKESLDNNFNYSRLVIEKNSDGVAKTFGKGIMQSTYLLKTGGALKLTTARIYWPDNETCIHSVGIIQDKELLNAVEKNQGLARGIEIANGIE